MVRRDGLGKVKLMENNLHQRKLSSSQVEAFHYSGFVTDQVADFALIVPTSDELAVVVDVGGGCGYFAKALGEAQGLSTRVIDTDIPSVRIAQGAGVEAEIGNALAPTFRGDEGVACFNLVLHHLVGSTHSQTRALQEQALAVWRGHCRYLFVHEYVYESYFGDLSGWMIFTITSSRILSGLALIVATLFPSLRANTFGVGVRFRSHDSWLRLFNRLGYEVVGAETGRCDRVTLPQRILAIRYIRRDSFCLQVTTGATQDESGRRHH